MAAQQDPHDPRIAALITDLEQRVNSVYPEVTFEIFDGDDPKGTYLRAIVDVEDPDDITDLIIEPLLQLQVEERLPLYFIAARPDQHPANSLPSGRRQRPYVAAATAGR